MNFRDKDNISLLQLFRDNLQDLYDMQYDIDEEHLSQPKDFYTALSDATETARDNHYVALDTLHTTYLITYYYYYYYYIYYISHITYYISLRILQDRQDRR